MGKRVHLNYRFTTSSLLLESFVVVIFVTGSWGSRNFWWSYNFIAVKKVESGIQKKCLSKKSHGIYVRIY